jgi:low affinity Fe/Cu permease
MNNYTTQTQTQTCICTDISGVYIYVCVCMCMYACMHVFGDNVYMYVSVCMSFSLFTIFFLISNSNLLKSAKGRNPYTHEVYKRALKRVEHEVNLKSLQK